MICVTLIFVNVYICLSKTYQLYISYKNVLCFALYSKSSAFYNICCIPF